MKTSVNLTLRQIAVGAIVAALVGFGIAAASFGLGYSKHTTVAPPNSVAASAAPAIPAESVAVVQLEGTGEDQPKKAAYRCAAGYAPIQVPVGKTVQADGATYELKETRPEYSTDQESVKLRIQLPVGVSAPSAIVNTAAHNRMPELYPQYKLEIALNAGGKGDYILLTRGYADVFTSVGITDVTICTTKTK